MSVCVRKNYELGPICAADQSGLQSFDVGNGIRACDACAMEGLKASIKQKLIDRDTQLPNKGPFRV